MKTFIPKNAGSTITDILLHMNSCWQSYNDSYRSFVLNEHNVSDIQFQNWVDYYYACLSNDTAEDITEDIEDMMIDYLVEMGLHKVTE